MDFHVQDYIGDTKLQGRDILNRFILQGLHAYTILSKTDFWFQECNAKTVYCVARVLKKNGRTELVIFKNAGNEIFCPESCRLHAERRLVNNYLNEIRPNDIAGTVKIFLNYSPCCYPEHECGKLLSDLCNRRSPPPFKLEIVFSALHMVRRPSCPRNVSGSDCKCQGYVSTKHSVSLENLLNMDQSLILRCFTSQDWKELVCLLTQWDFKFRKNKRKFDDLRAMRFGFDLQNTRNNEDKLTRKDFEFLLQEARTQHERRTQEHTEYKKMMNQSR